MKCFTIIFLLFFFSLLFHTDKILCTKTKASIAILWSAAIGIFSLHSTPNVVISKQSNEITIDNYNSLPPPRHSYYLWKSTEANMETGTIFVLTIQLTALFSIAGALLLYLLCKVRGARNMPIGKYGGSILITSADTALGLQLCTHLASRGCRVFAGMKDPIDSLPAKLLKGWMKMKENDNDHSHGAIVPLRLDVTREDLLREATEAVGAHLNACERGN